MKKSIKLLLTLVVLLTAHVNLTAASPFFVKGELVDSIFNQGEPYVTIRIFADDNTQSPILVSVTDELGLFNENLPKGGAYDITFSAVGRQSISKKFTVTTTTPIADLGTLFIKDNEEMLSELVVTARKPLVKADADKLVYDLAEDPATKNNTLLEMLRKVPMVTVDADDNIKLNGSSNFKIYINGKPDPMLSNDPKQILKALPASTIQKIEVITEPGAKYDAEGIGGILNLVTETRNSADGVLANFTLVASNRDATATIYARTKKDKVTVSANYTHMRQFENENTNYGSREIFNSTDQHFNNWNMTVRQHAKIHIGDLQFSYEPDSLNLFTISGNIVAIDGYGIINGKYEMLSSNLNPTWRYKSMSDAYINYITASAATSYQHSFAPNGHNLVVSYLYNYGLNHRDFSNEYYDYENFHPTLPNHINNVTLPSNEHTIQVDYTNPINAYNTLEAGAKYIIRRNNSYSEYYTQNADEYILDPTNSIDMQQFQDIAAIYAAYSFNYNRFGLNAGLRYEHTRMGIDFFTLGYDDFTSHLNDIVPNAMLTYRLEIAGMLRLSYNMRITRPNVDAMNPFRDTTDPTDIQHGNPNLTSERNNQVALTLSDFSHKIGYNISLRYNNTTNMISRYTYLDNSVFYTTSGNFGSYSATSLNAYASWNITPKILLSLNGTVIYADYHDNKMNIANSGWSGNFSGNFNYDMPWRLRLSAYGGYGTKSVSLQGSSTSWNYYGLSLSRKFLKDDRLEIAINANQFLTPRNKYTTTTITDTFRSQQTYANPQWKVGISISYRLGGLKHDVKKTSKAINNDDIHKSESSGSIM